MERKNMIFSVLTEVTVWFENEKYGCGKEIAK